MKKRILDKTMLKDALKSDKPNEFQKLISQIINGTTELPKDVFQWLQTLEISQQEKFLSASKSSSNNKNMSIIEFISESTDFDSELFNYIDTLIEFKSEGIHFKVPLDVFLQVPKTRDHVFKKTVHFLEKIAPLLTIKHLIEFEKIECSLLAKLLNALDGDSKSEKHILLKTLLSKVLNTESCQRILETSLLQKLCFENNDMALLLILEILHEKLGKDVLFQKLNTRDNNATPLLHSLFLVKAFFSKDYFFKIIDYVFLQDDKVIIDLFQNSRSKNSFVKSLSQGCSDKVWYFYDSLLKRTDLRPLIATPTLLSPTIKYHVVTKEQQVKMTALILKHKEIQDQLKRSRQDLKNVLDCLSTNKECLKKVFAFFVYTNDGLALQKSFLQQPYSKQIIEYLTNSDTNTLFHFLEVLCSSSEESSSRTIEDILNLDVPNKINFYEHLIKRYRSYGNTYDYIRRLSQESLEERTELSLLIIGLLEKITIGNLSQSAIKIQEVFDVIIPYSSIKTLEKILGFILQKKLVPEFLARVKTSDGELLMNFFRNKPDTQTQVISNNIKSMMLDLVIEYLDDNLHIALFRPRNNLKHFFDYLFSEPNSLLFSKLSNFPYHKIQDEKIRTTVITQQIRVSLQCRDKYRLSHPQGADEYTPLLDQLILNLFNHFKKNLIFTSLSWKFSPNDTPNWFRLSSQNNQEAWEADPILKYLYDTFNDQPKFIIEFLHNFVPDSFNSQNTPPKLIRFYNQLFSIASEKNLVITNADKFANKGIDQADWYYSKLLRAQNNSWQKKINNTDEKATPIELIQEHGKSIRQLWDCHRPIVENYIEQMVNNSMQEMFDFSSIDPNKKALPSLDHRIKILEQSIKNIEEYLSNFRCLFPNSYLLSKAYTALIDWYKMLMALDPENLMCEKGSEKVDLLYSKLIKIDLEKNPGVQSKILYLPDEFLKYLADKLLTIKKEPHTSKRSLLLNTFRFISAFNLIESARKGHYSIKPLKSSYNEEFIVDEWDTQFYNQLLLDLNIPANSEYNVAATFPDNIERSDVEVIKSGKQEVDPYPGPSTGAEAEQDNSGINRNAFFSSNPPQRVKKAKLEEQANSTLNNDIERSADEVIKSGKQEVDPYPGPSIGAKDQQDDSDMNRNAFFDSKPPELLKKVKLEEQANSTLNKEI
ncbi:hypothetical protein [Legionella waltersii]|uniref:Uncharacterized protein n=1 Tax=Legionella waltersii TaxID=66969 RepID=A0A0W1A5G5_9GAMM|nr:hypothetical protein [Legionella waltersii]KTD76610.1 hypothetical protein Lwal_2332 [Legionella waltersii]SNU94624.1 Uncharacterised protein [Legionella waltersii]